MMKNKRYVIVGMGKTGLSYARYCLEQGTSFTVTDSRPQPPQLAALQAEAKNIECAVGNLSKEMILNAECLLISPGISLAEPLIAQAIAQGVEVMNDVSLFAQSVTEPLVAITGSNGKSTVTTLVGEMARAAGRAVQVAGNIGLPVLDVLVQKRSLNLYVIEVSSFQLEKLSSFRSDVAALLNVSEDHMDYHSNMEEYRAIKKRIYQGCRIAVVNRHDSRLHPDYQVEQIISFGLDRPAAGQWGIMAQRNGEYLAYGHRGIMPIDQIGWSGAHRRINCLAALAIGQALGLEQEAMLSAIKSFAGLPHRCQWLCDLDGIHWYNDSKGTNVGATIAAIESLNRRHEGKIILIAGGMSKGADFTPLRPLIKQHVRKLLIIGEAATQLQRILHDVVDIERVMTLDAAVEKADLAALRGDVILLSPACASFDMYDNYQRRGEHFTELVRAMQ
ncbi:MAG: UDP-N-acetylmuramoyl-L-alanine--D-glutamate ligase [Gammaproteobacteria bacterium]|nr:UDP-N-acetylmuramoyl-L-alanine--D-glutamate ligase [Gammaproteobacteria bacterium]